MSCILPGCSDDGSSKPTANTNPITESSNETTDEESSTISYDDFHKKHIAVASRIRIQHVPPEYFEATVKNDDARTIINTFRQDNVNLADSPKLRIQGLASMRFYDQANSVTCSVNIYEGGSMFKLNGRYYELKDNTKLMTFLDQLSNTLKVHDAHMASDILSHSKEVAVIRFEYAPPYHHAVQLDESNTNMVLSAFNKTNVREAESPKERLTVYVSIVFLSESNTEIAIATVFDSGLLQMNRQYFQLANDAQLMAVIDKYCHVEGE